MGLSTMSLSIGKWMWLGMNICLLWVCVFCDIQTQMSGSGFSWFVRIFYGAAVLRRSLIRHLLRKCHLPLKGKARDGGTDCGAEKGFPFRGSWHGEAVTDEVICAAAFGNRLEEKSGDKAASCPYEEQDAAL